MEEARGVKISTTQENLATGLGAVSRVSSRNINLPILQNVLIRADEKVLKLATTNLEIAVSCLVRGKVEDGGEFTVPAKLFADYVNLLPNEKIDLEVVGAALRIRSGKSETKLNGIPATEFPVIPPVTGGKQYRVSIKPFHDAVGAVLFAVAQGEARPELSGVLFSFHHTGAPKGSLTLAATDSYRLGEVVVPLATQSSPEAAELVIPARTLGEVLRILGAGENDVDAPEHLTITVTENQVQFNVGNTELQSRVIEGRYPDYRQIIPAQFRTEAVIPRDEFIGAVKAASLFTKAGLYDVRLEFAPKKPLVIRATDAQTGEHRAEIACATTGTDNHVVVNYKYLLDGLGAIKDDEVVFRLIDAANPCLVTPKSGEESYRYIVMPIKQ